MTGPSYLAPGEVLVPRATPPGPSEARIAWAYNLGTRVTVLEVEDAVGDLIIRIQYARHGGQDTLTLSTLDLTHERPDGTPIVPPVDWTTAAIGRVAA